MLTARLMVLGAALLFSTGGAAIKSCQISAWQVAGFRSGIAALVILLLVPESRRGWNWRVVLVALAYALTLTLFAVANKLTTAANTIFLQSTAPLYVLLLSPLLLAEKVRRRDLLVLAILGSGVVLFFLGHESASRTAPDPSTGNLLAACTGLTWGLTLLGLRWLAREGQAGAAGAAVLGSLFSFLFCLPLAWPLEAGSMGDWAALLYLGVFQVGVAYCLLTCGMGRVTAFQATLILMAEPALSPIWAWLAHGELPAALSLLGGGVIFAGLLLNLLRRG